MLFRGRCRRLFFLLFLCDRQSPALSAARATTTTYLLLRPQSLCITVRERVFNSDIGGRGGIATHDSLRFASEDALSFGFALPAAAFFCALTRSCSRWFPPEVGHRQKGRRVRATGALTGHRD
jgi:hypothetical protein